MEQSIERVEALLLIAAMVAMLARRLRLPYTVGLMLAGIAMALSHHSVHVDLTKELIFTVFLPPLIFEAALHIRWRALRRDAPVVLVLATLGVFLAFGITAGGLHYLANWPWAAAVPLGVLISATDPVSVIATFREAGAKGRLRLLVESESLFNDGTVAVLYTAVLAALAGGNMTGVELLGRFLAGGIGGMVCGLLTGGVVLVLVGRTDDHLIEVTFSTVGAYGSFLLAEYFHVSGVLATLTAGVLIGNTSSLKIFSEKGLAAVQSFWEYLGFAANSLIFLLIGARLVAQDVAQVLSVAALVIVLVLVGRAIAVYGCCALFVRSSLRVSGAHQHLLFWGGLRGALALALALGLPEDLPLREEIISVTFMVVAFSILIQGLTMTPLLHRLGELEPGQ